MSKSPQQNNSLADTEAEVVVEGTALRDPAALPRRTAEEVTAYRQGFEAGARAALDDIERSVEAARTYTQVLVEATGTFDGGEEESS